jgi:hypothetical protein
MILINRVFTKEKITSSLMKSSSPFFIQEFRPLILLKTKDRLTSLTVIGVMKIMCNRHTHRGSHSSSHDSRRRYLSDAKINT